VVTPASAREVQIASAPTLRVRLVKIARSWARRLLEWLETRRAHAQRRRPAGLKRRLHRARSVLILCQGNVSRSVFAAHVLAKETGARAPEVRSAGLGTEPGWRAHPRVIVRCQDLNIDVRRHASAAVTARMVRAADIVFVMEVAHLVAVTRRFPFARRKTFLLTSLAPQVAMDIVDPAGKPDREVDACLDHVARALEPVISVLARRERFV
jgi:protein-tyrosine-phosphatase